MIERRASIIIEEKTQEKEKRLSIRARF